LKNISIIQPGEFQRKNHWYPQALDAKIHPEIKKFFELSAEDLVRIYQENHPFAKAEVLMNLIHTRPQYFKWAGCDLISTVQSQGEKKMVVIETNSCPSGQKSMPLLYEQNPLGGYKTVIENAFCDVVGSLPKSDGSLAVLYDKNYVENSGYAQVIANVFQEPVYLVEWKNTETPSPVRYSQNRMEICIAENEWIPLRAAYRYITQKPWNRLRSNTKTLLFNPIVVDIAGGRNKIMAHAAYTEFNEKHALDGIKIELPKTEINVPKNDIPALFQKFHKEIVVKIPYSNAGQGVFTILNEKELDDFMKIPGIYDCYLVQELIAAPTEIRKSQMDRIFHTGFVNQDDQHLYAFDIRMMVCNTSKGLRPAAIYGRKAHNDLESELVQSMKSWDVYGTNLSIKLAENSWDSDTSRLCLMSEEDFPSFNLNMNQWVESYFQTIFSVLAIDDLSEQILLPNKSLDLKKILSVNNDRKLVNEIEME